ncbi:MAG: ABC transporter ATP-binding protein [Burkholderiales bacterium]
MEQNLDPSEALVALTNVSKSYATGAGRQVVLDGVSLRMLRGELVSIKGPSGSGKSTLLKLILGIEDCDHGEIRVRGVNLLPMDETARARVRARYLAIVFQNYNLIPFLNARENVELPLVLAGMHRVDRRSASLQALDVVGLAHKAESFPKTLSGGESQRVAIARALVRAPDIVLCDEPTGSLNETGALEVFDLIKRIAHEHQRSVLLVTHNERLAADADRRFVLSSGKLGPV